MLFIQTVIFALMAVSANAQTKRLNGYIGSNTGCRPGNFLFCNAREGDCCFQAGVSFGSARFENPTANEQINGAIPVSGNSGQLCGPIVRRSRFPGECISAGPSGFSAFGRSRRGGPFKRADKTDNTDCGGIMTGLSFGDDDQTFDLLALTDEEVKVLLEVAVNSTSSADVPAELWKAAI